MTVGSHMTDSFLAMAWQKLRILPKLKPFGILLSMDIIVSEKNLLTETMDNKMPNGLNLNAMSNTMYFYCENNHKITSRKISDSICLLGALE